VQRPEHQWETEQQRDQREASNRHVYGEDISHRLAQIVVDPPSEPHRADDRGEIVIEQDQ
jgi:hypothetical protein